MIVSQFRTFQDIFGKEPILVSPTAHSVSTENPKTGKTVTIIPIPNTTQAVVSAMQSGVQVQKPEVVSTANQSLFSQLVQKLVTTNETIPEGGSAPAGLPEAEVQPKKESIFSTLKKNWLLIIVALVAIIGVILII